MSKMDKPIENVFLLWEAGVIELDVKPFSLSLGATFRLQPETHFTFPCTSILGNYTEITCELPNLIFIPFLYSPAFQS